MVAPPAFVDWRARPVLPPAATARLDRAAVAAGIPGAALMEAAGRAVARAMTARFPPQPVLVLCGPGMNGGDGYVAARRLREAGWPVRVLALGDPARLAGDAALARAAWAAPAPPATPGALAEGGERLVVDALFGVGLARPLEGAAAALVGALGASGAAVAAVDVPSGVNAGTGAVAGGASAVRAALTVSFVTAKPGHLLLPGRLHAGELLVADIGVPAAAVAAEDGDLRANGPALWRAALPARTPASHKFLHGHAAVLGGPAGATGAARLAAEAAARAGAGLTTVLAAPDAIPAYAARLTSVMTRPVAGPADLRAFLDARKVTAALLGPGAGTGPETLARLEALLAWGRPLALDADALTVLGPELRAGRLRPHGACVLTPHDGEFGRLFDLQGDRLARARAAAAACGAVVLLKGGDTVVAAPDGRAGILTDAPPGLSTAGTGDVLAGLTAGLLAQGLPPFEAAAAAAWLHGDLARRAGPRLVAEDLLPHVTAALAEFG